MEPSSQVDPGTHLTGVCLESHRGTCWLKWLMGDVIGEGKLREDTRGRIQESCRREGTSWTSEMTAKRPPSPR